jgi:ATP-dependent exoDNAse (exonuclease V) alpha subunit
MANEKMRDTIHVSVRLPWHDRAWDGRACNDSASNWYCGGFHSVNAERMRTYKFVNASEKCQSLGENGEVVDKPPCTETINVFGTETIKHTHIPPSFLFKGGTKPRDEDLPAYSSGTWNFEDMWDENGNPRPTSERKKSAQEFFSALKEGESLIFYYCNYDNPITVDTQQYLLAGIARLKMKRPDFVYWREIPPHLAQKYGDFVWSWVLQNGYPEEGVRIPYQEYLTKGKKPEELHNIAVIIEEDLARRFKYVSRDLTNDNATILIEETIRALRQVKKDGIVTGKNCDWDRQIEWLDSIFRECWKKRGRYPGLASTLDYCGFKNPGIYVKDLLSKMGSKDLRDYVFSRLETESSKKIKMSKQEADLYACARDRYNALSPIVRKLCKEQFPLFDLTDKQVRNILGDHRVDFGIVSSLETIYDNPYCICEEYVGSDIEDRIGFHRIDNGMLPNPEIGNAGETIALDDPRRLRAIMVKMLGGATDNGHTFMDRQDLLAAIHKKHETSGRKGRFLFDEATFIQNKPLFTQKLVIDQVAGLDAIFLRRLHDAERKIREETVQLMKEEPLPPSERNWEKIIREGFKEQGIKVKPIKDALKEQIRALEILYQTRFGVLTGGAGVGKTTVLWAFVRGVLELDPDHEFLLLAPTGKASVIMRQKVGLEARTIHSFLMQHKWLNPKNWTLLPEGGRKAGGYKTVIIDEASMLNVDLMATLFRALNWNEIERLILVGDPSQLPPIGPGKPFADILDHLRSNRERKEKHLAELTFNCRQSQGSLIAKLAAHYARSEESPDEEILWRLDQRKPSKKGSKKGKKRPKDDLVICYWQSEKELLKLLEEVLLAAETEIAEAKGIKLPKKIEKLDHGFDLIHGLNELNAPKDLEAIQLISPFRHKASGVDPLNFFIQRLLRGDETVRKFAVNGFVFRDKILQIQNYYYRAYDHDVRQHVQNQDTYIPNGSIGYVFPKRVNDTTIQAKFPKEFGRYSYYLSKKQCEENLELGYVLSVHKSQGSQFTNTIFVLPAEESDFLSRELLYTALTRAQGKLYLLLEKNAHILKDRLWTGHSEILRRNSALFRTAKGIPKEGFKKYRPENLVYEALPGQLVRSHDEVLISQALTNSGIPFYYEKILPSKDKQSFRLPDFTFQYRRRTYFWEHRGRFNDPQYAENWKNKEKWYKKNGYEDQLLITPVEGMTLEQSIQYILHDRLGVTDGLETA